MERLGATAGRPTPSPTNMHPADCRCCCCCLGAESTTPGRQMFFLERADEHFVRGDEWSRCYTGKYLLGRGDLSPRGRPPPPPSPISIEPLTMLAKRHQWELRYI